MRRAAAIRIFRVAAEFAFFNSCNVGKQAIIA